jgi:hypothetical protein
MSSQRSVLKCTKAAALVAASALAGCTVHPGPDVALNMQHVGAAWTAGG